MTRFALEINSRQETVDADPEMPLLWALRDLLNHDGHKIWLRYRALRSLPRNCPPRRCSLRTLAPPTPKVDEAMAGNLCRCATYFRIRSAIRRAAAETRS